MSDDKFLVQICSDVDYEELVTYLMYENSVVFVLNCDLGIENTVIEIMDKFTNEVLWTIDYFVFIKFLEDGSKFLEEVNHG